MVKVSVLIPLYNQENYIEECLKSVIEQTYTNIEIIVLDDGSTDSSSALVKKYLRDNRIILLHQSNSGLGATRNRLVNEATGDYIFHLDSDDFITTRCIENLVSIQRATFSDLIFSNFQVVDDNMRNLKNIKRKHFSNKEAYVKYYLSGFGFNSVCNVLINRELYTKYKIFVPNINYGEDWSVIYKLVYFSKSISYSSEFSYYYRKNENGMTYSKLPERNIMKNIDNILVGKSEYYKFITDNQLFDIYQGEINSYMIEVKNSIFSILIRNNKSMVWYRNNVEKRYGKILLTFYRLINTSNIWQKLFRRIVLLAKCGILYLNSYKES